MRGGDSDILQNVISECVAAGVPELDRVIEEARRTLISRGYAGDQGAFFVPVVIFRNPVRLIV